MCACGCEAVIWCMDVGVKADRLRIVIIPVPSINYSLLVIIIHMCGSVYFTAHCYNQYYYV